MALGFGVILVLVLIAYMVFPKKRHSPQEKHVAHIPQVFESRVEQPVVTSFREQINLEDQAILAEFFVEKRKKKQRDELLTEFKSYLDS